MSKWWMIALFVLLAGCRFFGENQVQQEARKIDTVRQEQTQTATAATGAATVKEWAPPAAAGRDAAVTVGDNVVFSGNIVYAPVFNAPAESARREVSQESKVDATALTKEKEKTKEETESRIEIKSSWYWLIIAVALILAIAAIDYVRRVWFGGFSIKAGQFDLSKAGGLRVFDKIEKVIGDHHGDATNPETVAAFRALKDEIIELKTALKLKRRSDD